MLWHSEYQAEILGIEKQDRVKEDRRGTDVERVWEASGDWANRDVEQYRIDCREYVGRLEDGAVL